MEVTIQMLWDKDAQVWTAESEDVPGLVLESGSLDALIERVRFAVPELLELNGPVKSPVTMNLVSRRLEQVAV